MLEIPPFQISLPDKLTDPDSSVDDDDAGASNETISNQLTEELASAFDSTVTSSGGISQTPFSVAGGASSASSQSSSFVDDTGGGTSSEATATSPTGETSSSSAEEFTPGATFSSGSASASSALNYPTTSATATTDFSELSGQTAEVNRSSSNTSTVELNNHENSGNSVSLSISQKSEAIAPSDNTQTSINSSSSHATREIISDEKTVPVTVFADSPDSSSNLQLDLTGSENSQSNLSNHAINLVLPETVFTDVVSNNSNPRVSQIYLPFASVKLEMIVGGEIGEMIPAKIGHHYLRGMAGNDRVLGGGEADILNGNQDDDIVEGGAGDDLVRGGKGNDTVIGGDGDDFLFGDYGTDEVIGGSGADTFVCRTETAENDRAIADKIIDFNQDQRDKIGLTGVIVFDNISLEVFDSDGDGTADATLVQLKTNNNGILAVLLGTVDSSGASILTDSDFITVPQEILAFG